MRQNKIALVTGGSRGLGKAIALRIAQKGIDVVLTYHQDQEAANQVVNEIQQLGQKAIALPLSVGELMNIDHFVIRFQESLQAEFNCCTIDFLINNGGSGPSYASIAETSSDQFDQLSSVYFKGVFFFTQKIVPLLNDNGAIINMSNGLARVVSPGRAAYACMKSAIETLTRYLAQELGTRRIQVNVVAPGAIATESAGGINHDPQIQTYLKSIAAIPRLGQPDDIGGVIAFLCTDDARWITGQRLEVSGGMAL